MCYFFKKIIIFLFASTLVFPFKKTFGCPSCLLLKDPLLLNNKNILSCPCIQPCLEKIIFYHHKMHYYQQLLFTKKDAKKNFLHYSYLLEDLLDLIQTENYMTANKKKNPLPFKKRRAKTSCGSS